MNTYVYTLEVTQCADNDFSKENILSPNLEFNAFYAIKKEHLDNMLKVYNKTFTNILYDYDSSLIQPNPSTLRARVSKLTRQLMI